MPKVTQQVDELRLNPGRLAPKFTLPTTCLKQKEGKFPEGMNIPKDLSLVVCYSLEIGDNFFDIFKFSLAIPFIRTKSKAL